MAMLSRIVLGCSYMIALVLAVAWMVGALRGVDTEAGGSIVVALAAVTLCGLGVGLASRRFGAQRRSRAKLPDLGRSGEKPKRY
jgi:hypothetical protein